ncbi:uncharacterized protein ASCRUDRAFT_96205 [Ascoidea rubescens DSM 1968]|uniref:BTB domain-containing protein n=1 Tax=Ascoidea rubescens DSM 1968 TaxID=1344418 RepID=A0A1D2VPE8_9ASCO|nr:hypothetical protein ASCRUDRAFT_96205 [Ascoidea rubescens DSM 1968]ODV63480.1 hypothetical protein ASCRUDRAFT_96205 [Ascoidea rubescens DSM 1968]
MDTKEPLQSQELSALLSNLNEYDLQKRDIFGRNVLHWVCILGRSDILQRLLKLYYNKKILYLCHRFKSSNHNSNNKKFLNIHATDYESGYNILHLSIINGNFSCVSAIIHSNIISSRDKERLKNARDREGLTPIDLLKHYTNTRTFYYYPSSIGKDSDFYCLNTSINSNYQINVEKRWNIQELDKCNPNDSNYQAYLRFKKNTPVIDNWWTQKRGALDIFMLGSNINGILGTGDLDDRLLNPTKVAIKQYNSKSATNNRKYLNDILFQPRIKNIFISKYHSIVLTNEQYDNIYICGKNSKGLLGLGELDNQLPKLNFIPTGDNVFEDINIVDVALSLEHTLCLSSKGEVYSWGLNNYGQLGYKVKFSPNDNLSKNKKTKLIDPFNNFPKKISGDLKKEKIIGISCSKIYSIAFSSSHIFFWGLNVGQIGITSIGDVIKYKNYSKAVVQSNPINIPFVFGTIQNIVSLEFATVILVESTNELHIYLNGFHIKVQPPLYLSEFRQLSNLEEKKEKKFHTFQSIFYTSRRKIVKIVGKDVNLIDNIYNFGILFDTGDLFTFKIDVSIKNILKLQKSIKFKRVWKPRSFSLIVTDFEIGADGSFVFCTADGAVYKTVSKTLAFENSISFKDIFYSNSDFKFIKVPKLTNIVKVSCDSLFSTFGFLKNNTDLLPLRIKQEQINNDIQYLSPLCRFSPLSKRDDLFSNEYHIQDEFNTFYFMQQQKLLYEDNSFSIDDDNIHEKNQTISLDHWKKSYLDRWEKRYKLTTNSHLSSYDSFEKLKSVLNLKKIAEKLSLIDFTTIKNYDCFFQVENTKIGAHKIILASRSPVFYKLFQSSNNVLTKDDLKISYDPKTEVINVQNANINSVLIIIHLFYTDQFVSTWENYKIKDESISEIILETKKFTFKLLEIFLLNFSVGRYFKNRFCQDLRNSIDNPSLNSFNDVTFQLSDGKISCASCILLARSAYFETMFSRIWFQKNFNKTINFSHVECNVFKVVLKHLYGCDFLDLLDSSTHQFSVDELIDFSLKVIAASDELMLFTLKDYFQCFIIDFIDADNVIELLNIADALNAKKLFENSMWFIFNNLEELLFRPFSDLNDNSVLKKVEKYMKFFHLFQGLKDPIQKELENSKVEDSIQHYSSEKSDSLLKGFINDMKKTNELFLDRKDETFHPIIDIDILEPKPIRIEKALPSVSTEEIKLNLSSAPIGIPINSVLSLKPSVIINEDSVLDEMSSDEEFIPVVSNRRKSSQNKNNSLNSKLSQTQTRKYSKTDYESSFVYLESPEPRKLSFSSFNADSPLLSKTQILGNFSESKPIHENNNDFKFGLSANSNWGSINNSSKTLYDNFNDNIWPDLQGPLNTSKFGSKLNSKIFRLNQKEKRERRFSSSLKEPVLKEEVTVSKSSFKWKNNKSTIMNNKENQDKDGGNNETKSATSFSGSFDKLSAPSLSSIIYEEESRNNRKRAVEVKSLAEIQEEEEFQKWWEQESSRIQKSIKEQERIEKMMKKGTSPSSLSGKPKQRATKTNKKNPIKKGKGKGKEKESQASLNENKSTASKSGQNNGSNQAKNKLNGKKSNDNENSNLNDAKNNKSYHRRPKNKLKEGIANGNNGSSGN